MLGPVENNSTQLLACGLDKSIPAASRTSQSVLPTSTQSKTAGSRLLSDKIWKPIPGFEGDFEVSDYGDVRRVGGRIIKGYVDKDGYQRVYLRADNHRKKRDVAKHRLVLEAFEGKEPGMLALHKDDNKANNHRSNLYWGTRKDNAADAQRNHVDPSGERHPNAQLSLDDVRAIRASGETPQALAKLYAVSDAHIRLIRRGKKWSRHV